MKKYLLTTLISLCFFVASFAQIQRSFWGLTIGVSSKNSVINYLSTNNIDHSIESDHCIANNLTFADIQWKSVIFEFQNNILYTIGFSTWGGPEGLLDEIHSKLQRSYGKKYSMYYNENLSTANKTVFLDENLVVATIVDNHDYYKGERAVSLVFLKLGLGTIK